MIGFLHVIHNMKQHHKEINMCKFDEEDEKYFDIKSINNNICDEIESLSEYNGLETILEDECMYFDTYGNFDGYYLNKKDNHNDLNESIKYNYIFSEFCDKIQRLFFKKKNKFNEYEYSFLSEDIHNGKFHKKID